MSSQENKWFWGEDLENGQRFHIIYTHMCVCVCVRNSFQSFIFCDLQKRSVGCYCSCSFSAHKVQYSYRYNYCLITEQKQMRNTLLNYVPSYTFTYTRVAKKNYYFVLKYFDFQENLLGT
jgi:hypothetical protein